MGVPTHSCCRYSKLELTEETKMTNELKHYGVLGMRWGHKKGPSKPMSSKRSKTNKSPEEKKRRFKKAAKVAALSLAVVGGVAVAALVAKKSREAGFREGKIAAQQEAAMFRRAAAAKGVLTRAANRAARQSGPAVASALSSIGKIKINDYMSMVH